jgi:peptide deformylase
MQKLFKIVKDDHPSLREKSKEVEMPLSKKDKQLLLDMIEYLKLSQNQEYAKKHNLREGVGLAAPQININKRMLVIYFHDLDGNEIQYALVNPIIIANSVRKAYLEGGEGCLSVDEEHKGYVYRDYKITIKAFDAIKEENVQFSVRGYNAIVLQHEIDHLNGILFYDRIDKNNPFKKVEDSYII